MKLTESKLREIIKEELQQLNELETYELNQQLVMKLPDIFHHQLKRLSRGEYDDLLDKKELVKTLQKYMKLNKQLAVKFGNDIKKIKK